MPTVEERAIEWLGPHCDLATRLPAIPPAARARGVYMRSTLTALERHGKLEEYEQWFGQEHWAALRFYPVRDYVLRTAVAGAILRGPEHMHDGMFEIGKLNATSVANSLLGRVMLRLLSPKPERMLRQGIASRRQTTTSGRWDLEFPEERYAVMRFHEEFIWIESYLLGAAHGSFELIEQPVQIECELTGPFEGAHHIRW